MSDTNYEHPPAPQAPPVAPHVQQQAGYQSAQPPFARPRRSKIWLILGLMVGAGFLALWILPIAGAVLMGGGNNDPHGVHEFYREGEGEDKIAVIQVNGVIMEGGGGGFFSVPGMDPVSMVTDGLKRAADDKDVKGVVLEINSPGGGVGASDQIHHEIIKFKETGKPIMVYMKDLAASGGYYIAAPADYIVANRTTLTGSIGVIIQSYNFHGTLTEVVKGQDATIKAGGNKTMGSMFADPESEEYKEGRALLQELVDEMHTQFKGLVKEGRETALKPGWEALADGRIMSASKAKEFGFVDEIGYFEAVIKAFEDKYGIVDPTVVQYGRQVSLASMLGMSADDTALAASELKPAFTKAALANHVQETLRLYPGRPMAIWTP